MQGTRDISVGDFNIALSSNRRRKLTVTSQNYRPSAIPDDIDESGPEIRVRLVENVHLFYENK